MRKDISNIPIYVTSLVVLWVYVIARAFYVFVFLLLAGGDHLSPIVRPMQALWLLQLALTILCVWRPKAAMIGGIAYFLAISGVWFKYGGILSLPAYLYDRSLDILFLFALGGVISARSVPRHDL